MTSTTSILSFSGRQGEGNCSSIAEYIRSELTGKSKTIAHRLVEMNIRPCAKCRYECFGADTKCPINDDVRTIYNTLFESHAIVFIIPVYSGAPSALYFSFRERAQGIFTDELYDRYSTIPKHIIIIGNNNAGADNAVRFIESEENNIKQLILLQSHDYGLKSTDRNLLTNETVCYRITAFTTNIM